MHEETSKCEFSLCLYTVVFPVYGAITGRYVKVSTNVSSMITSSRMTITLVEAEPESIKTLAICFKSIMFEEKPVVAIFRKKRSIRDWFPGCQGVLGVPWGIVVGSYAPVDCCSVKKKDCLTTGAIPVSNVVLPRIEWNNYSGIPNGSTGVCFCYHFKPGRERRGAAITGTGMNRTSGNHST